MWTTAGWIPETSDCRAETGIASGLNAEAGTYPVRVCQWPLMTTEESEDSPSRCCQQSARSAFSSVVNVEIRILQVTQERGHLFRTQGAVVLDAAHHLRLGQGGADFLMDRQPQTGVAAAELARPSATARGPGNAERLIGPVLFGTGLQRLHQVPVGLSAGSGYMPWACLSLIHSR